METETPTKKPRSEAQKEANRKALAVLKEKREAAAAEVLARQKKELDEAEEILVSKVVNRLKEAPAVKEEKPAPVKKPARKVVIVEEDDEEEEVVVQKVIKKTPAISVAVPVEPKRLSTGNKLLDRLYGISQ